MIVKIRSWLAVGLLGLVGLGAVIWAYGDSVWQTVILPGGATRVEGDSVGACDSQMLVIMGGYSPGDTSYSIRVDEDGRIYGMIDSVGVVSDLPIDEVNFDAAIVELRDAFIAGDSTYGADLRGVDEAWIDIAIKNIAAAFIAADSTLGVDLRGVDEAWLDIAVKNIAAAYIAADSTLGIDLRAVNEDWFDLVLSKLDGAYIAADSTLGVDLRGVDEAWIDIAVKNLAAAYIAADTTFGADLRNVDEDWFDIVHAAIDGAYIAADTTFGADLRGVDEAWIDIAVKNLAAAFIAADTTFGVDLRGVTEADVQSAMFAIKSAYETSGKFIAVNAGSVGVCNLVDLVTLVTDVTTVGTVSSITDIVALPINETDHDAATAALADAHLPVHDAVGVKIVPDTLEQVDCVVEVETVTALPIDETSHDAATLAITEAYSLVDDPAEAGGDSSFTVDVMPHHGGRAVDTTFAAASSVWFPLYDRNWDTIRAEIVDVWARDCIDTVLVYGPFTEFEIILDATSGSASMRWDRCMADSVRHSPNGAGSVGHSGQGAVR